MSLTVQQLSTRRKVTLDGVFRPNNPPTPASAQTPPLEKPVPSDSSPNSRVESHPTQNVKKLDWLKLLTADSVRTDGLIILLLVLMGIIPGLLLRPHLVALLYALLVVILRIKSSKTFRFAFTLFGIIPVMYALGKSPLAEIYASVGFLFLAIGLVCSVLETNWRVQK